MNDNQISDALKIMNIGESPITGRIYPKEEIENALKHLQEKINSDTGCFGELHTPFPEQQTVHVQMGRISHQLTEVYIEDDAVYGKIRILNTPHGTILKSLVSDGVSFGLTPIMLAKVNEDKTVSDLIITKVNVKTS